MFKAVIFDLGKVLLAFDHNVMHGNMANTMGISIDSLKDAIAKQDLQNKFECGNITTKQILDALRTFSQNEFEDEEMITAFCDIFTEIQGMREIVTSLKGNDLSLAILSNTNSLHINWANEKFDFFDIFDQHIYSHEIHAMKPSPIIYNAAIEKLGLKAEDCIFIDDLQENIEGAQAVGIKSILFTGPESLRSALSELKVL